MSQTGGGCRATNYIGFIRKGQKQIDRPATQEYDQILYSLKVAALNSFEDIEF